MHLNRRSVQLVVSYYLKFHWTAQSTFSYRILGHFWNSNIWWVSNWKVFLKTEKDITMCFTEWISPLCDCPLCITVNRSLLRRGSLSWALELETTNIALWLGKSEFMAWWIRFGWITFDTKYSCTVCAWWWANRVWCSWCSV